MIHGGTAVYIVFAYPDIRIYPLVYDSQKSGYIKVKIRLLRRFAKIVQTVLVVLWRYFKL